MQQLELFALEGPPSVSELWEDIAHAARFARLTAEEERSLIARAEALVASGNHRMPIAGKALARLLPIVRKHAPPPKFPRYSNQP